MGVCFLLGTVGAGVLWWQISKPSPVLDPIADAASSRSPLSSSSPSPPVDVANEAPAETDSTRSRTEASSAPKLNADFTRPGEDRELRYQWKKGAVYTYDYKYNSTINGSEVNDSGKVAYQVASGDPSSIPADPIESTSTAFVVDPRGYLLTCAHCVRDALQIAVHLNGKKYAGKVLALDVANDLAVIKIEATGLAVVPLGVDRPVELAQGIRAAGHPLSDLLGNSLKITQGSIAGFVEVDGNRLYQVDASINSGNSGGPVFDDSGAALGVASAKLEGAAVTNVAFAMPIELAVPLLEFVGANYSAAIANDKVEGVKLARQLSPAIAFLEVKHSPTSGTAFQMVVSIGQGLNQQSYPMITDGSGQGISCNSQENLPAFLGPAWELALEQLPVGNEKQWSSTDQLVLLINVPTQETVRPNVPVDRLSGGYDPFGRFGAFSDPYDRLGLRTDPFDQLERLRGFRDQLSPYSNRGRMDGRSQPQEMQVEIPAIQTVSYRIESETSKEIRIHKKMELTTITGNQLGATISLKSSGIFRFDPLAGVSAGQEMNGEIQVNTTDEKVQIKFSFTYDRSDPTAVGRAIAKKSRSRDSAKPPSKTAIDSSLASQLNLPDEVLILPEYLKPKVEQPSAPEKAAKAVEKNLRVLKNFRNGQLESIQAGFACMELHTLAVEPRGARKETSLPTSNLQDEVRTALREFIEFIMTDERLPNSGLDHSAVDALGVWGKPEDGELFERLLAYSLGKNEYFLILSSMNGLAKFPTPERAAKIAVVLGDFKYQSESAIALKKFGSVAEHAVIAKLSEPDALVRRVVVELLGAIGTQDSIEALNDLERTETDAFVRMSIVSSKISIERRK